MTTKAEVTQRGQENAKLIVDNALIDGLSAQLKEKEKYGLTFPPDYNPTNALMGAYLVLKETTDKKGTPILQACSQASIANSLMDMCTYGLSVQKKQGYFIAYGGKCQFQKSYFGNTAIARRYGMKEINASVIYDGDVFEYHKEDGKTVVDKHQQSFSNIDNNKIIGAYAVAIMNDGTKYAEVMNMLQIRQAWKQGFGYKESGDTTHSKFTDQMAMKTVKNRLLKFINNTFGDTMIAYMDEQEEKQEPVDVIATDVTYDIETCANSEEMPVDATIFDDDSEVIENDVIVEETVFEEGK